MTKVRIRSYLSPTLVLLAFDWPDGAFREDFLGFAIEGGVPITGDGGKNTLVCLMFSRSFTRYRGTTG